MGSASNETGFAVKPLKAKVSFRATSRKIAARTHLKIITRQALRANRDKLASRVLVLFDLSSSTHRSQVSVKICCARTEVIGSAHSNRCSV